MKGCGARSSGGGRGEPEMTALVCPICGGAAFVQVLEREDAPVHQNLILETEAAALAARRGRLDVRCCMCCGFVFNAAFDAAALSYGEQYENTQLASPSFREYVGTLVRRMVDYHQVRG